MFVHIPQKVGRCLLIFILSSLFASAKADGVYSILDLGVLPGGSYSYG